MKILFLKTGSLNQFKNRIFAVALLNCQSRYLIFSISGASMLFSLEPQILVLLAFSLVFALSFHEFAHAYVADRFGDPTARMAGRLTVNPMVHLDVFGSLMVLVAGFGYAKPVPVNPRNFRHPRADAFVAAAGPLMNLLLGFVAGGLIHLFHFTGWLYWEGFPLVKFLTLFILINFNLCLFNLIPLGPLDGSYILSGFLNRELKWKYEEWNARFGYQALLGLVLVSVVIPGFSFFSWISQISRGMLRFVIG